MPSKKIRKRMKDREIKSSLFSKPASVNQKTKEGSGERSIEDPKLKEPTQKQLARANLKEIQRLEWQQRYVHLTTLLSGLVRSDPWYDSWTIYIVKPKTSDPLKSERYFASCKIHDGRPHLQLTWHRIATKSFSCKQCEWEKHQSENWKRYSLEVRKLTEHNYKLFHDYINPHGFTRGKDYHLDHVYSIRQAFEDMVPLEVTAHPVNLRMIPSRENLQKSLTCFMGRKELFRRYKEFTGKDPEL